MSCFLRRAQGTFEAEKRLFYPPLIAWTKTYDATWMRNTQQWLALSHSISVAEQVAFNKIHDEFFATYGCHFMAHVYRATFGRALWNMTNAERNKLMGAFRESLALASSEPHATQSY